MKLIRNKLEQYNPDHTNFQDQRKKETLAVFSYIDNETGHEYRKSFTFEVNFPEAMVWDCTPKEIITPN